MTDLDVDRDELRAAARDMLGAASTSARVRELAATPDGFDEDLWRHFAEMGLPGIEISEEFDGAGARFGDLAVVLTELGSHLASNGLAATTVLGAGALAAGPGHPRARAWLPRIAAGTARASAALLSAAGEPGSPGLLASPAAGGWRVSGSSGYAPDAGIADLLVLRALDPNGRELLLAVEAGTPGLDVAPAPMLDISRRFSVITATELEAGEADVLAGGTEAETIVRRLLDRAALAAAADALGVAQRALDTTVDYAKTREQFGRAIGSFQAVKHRCADMFVAVTTARIALEEALDRYDAAPDDAAAAISRAKAYTCDAAARVVEDGTDMHGGIGFTWEHDMHLLVKRARLDQALYGDSRTHRRRAADLTWAPAAS
jgi:alkylation response protein AidB-like acyl-CoA dehydrogenase